MTVDHEVFSKQNISFQNPHLSQLVLHKLASLQSHQEMVVLGFVMSEMWRFGLENDSGFQVSWACAVQKVLSTISRPLNGLQQEVAVDHFVSSAWLKHFCPQGIHEEWLYWMLCFQNWRLVPRQSAEPVPLPSRFCACAISGIKLWERGSLSWYSVWWRFLVGWEDAHRSCGKSPSTFLECSVRVCSPDKGAVGAARWKPRCWIWQFLWGKTRTCAPKQRRGMVLFGWRFIGSIQEVI